MHITRIVIFPVHFLTNDHTINTTELTHGESAFCIYKLTADAPEVECIVVMLYLHVRIKLSIYLCMLSGEMCVLMSGCPWIS